MPNEGQTEPQTTIVLEIDGKPTGRFLTVPFSPNEVECFKMAIEAEKRIGVVSASGSGPVREAHLRNRIPWGYGLIGREEALQTARTNLAVWYVIKNFVPATLTDEDWVIVDNSVAKMISSLVPALITPEELIEAILKEVGIQSQIRFYGNTGGYVRFCGSIAERCNETGELDDGVTNAINAAVFPRLLDQQLEDTDMNAQTLDYFWDGGKDFQRGRIRFQNLRAATKPT